MARPRLRAVVMRSSLPFRVERVCSGPSFIALLDATLSHHPQPIQPPFPALADGIQVTG